MLCSKPVLEDRTRLFLDGADEWFENGLKLLRQSLGINDRLRSTRVNRALQQSTLEVQSSQCSKNRILNLKNALLWS